MKKVGLPLLILLMGALYIFVVPSEPHAVKLLFKLVPMWLVIAYAYVRMPTPWKSAHWLLLTGLFFCMLGDGLLGWFVVGLSAFLVGHLFYLASFWREHRPSRLRSAAIVPIACFAVYMGWELVHALARDDKHALVFPVLLYIAVISLMAWSAIRTGKTWAIVGGLLFLASDAILSWNLFVSDVAYAGVLIMTTYYVAQFCIAHSIRTTAAPTPIPKGAARLPS
ncbi:lysoplasmalogenase [Cohnella sp. REN36]|uniref:lysoplasmalogenase n=1 Tax=Cohnella sp. REN36 TaxID=2887347 RepID=UPI001D14AD4E|nr:lysoplasmalogenase [Cohnella sp. REN36]